MIQVFDFISDPGHGWLRVPLSTILSVSKASGVSLILKISHFSYFEKKGQGVYLYLEEDCDAPLFLCVADKVGLKYRINERSVNETHIRNLPAYPAPEVFLTEQVLI